MVLGLIIRSGIVVGALYYSQKLGVWGNGQQTEQLYNCFKSQMRPYFSTLQQKIPIEVPALPQVGEVRYLAKHYYNAGVKNSFNFLGNIPTHTTNLVQKGADLYQEFAKSPPTAKS